MDRFHALSPDALRMVVTIARTGSFAAAARELGKEMLLVTRAAFNTNSEGYGGDEVSEGVVRWERRQFLARGLAGSWLSRDGFVLICWALFRHFNIALRP